VKHFFILALGLVCASAALADDDEAAHVLATAAGIASPGAATAAYENPAGLTYNKVARVHANFVAETSVGYGGEILAPVDRFVVEAGLRGQNLYKYSPGNISLLDWGLATTLETLNVAIGIEGSKVVREVNSAIPTNGTCTSWCLDAGAILYPSANTRFALNAIEITDNHYYYGGGVAFNFDTDFVGAIDYFYDTTDSWSVVTPGLNFPIFGIQTSISYSAKTGGASGILREGVSVGTAWPLGDGLLLLFYINHIAQYYAGLTIPL